MVRKLLILGGANMHCKIVNAAREMGIYTVVTDYIPNSPAKKMADKAYDIDIVDTEQIIEMCKKEQITAVLSTHIDPCQKPYYKICHALNLPCYIDNEYQLSALTDKNVFKRECLKAGLDVIETYSLDDKTSIQYPVLVKPACNRGSRSQNVCNNEKELTKAVKIAEDASYDHKAIIEKYMCDAQDFTITYMYADGVPYLERIGDRYMGPLENRMESVVSATVCPSFAYDYYKEQLESRVLKLMENLEIKNGPVFFQAFLDGDKLRMYDPGYRFPGCEYENGFKAATDIDAIKIMIEFAFTGKMRNQYFTLDENSALLNGKTQAVVFPLCRNGKLTEYRGLDRLRKNSWLVNDTQRYVPGDEIEYTTDVRQQIAEFNVITDDRKGLVDAIESINNIFKAMDDTGKDMIFSKLDAKKVLDINFAHKNGGNRI